MKISFARPQSNNVETYTFNIAVFLGLALVLLVILFVMAPLATVNIASDLQSQADRTRAAGDLPASTAEAQRRPDKPLFLTVKSDLTLALGNDPVQRELLRGTLDVATKGDKDTRIFLRADKAVPYGELMEVLDLMRTAGYSKVALVGLEKTTVPVQGPRAATEPTQGRNTPESLIAAPWKTQIVAMLERNKRYPEAAQSRRQQGIALVFFSLDRQGRLIDSRIERSSGVSELDEEALALLHRAQPFPPPPPELPGERVNLTVPVRFNLNQPSDLGPRR